MAFAPASHSESAPLMATRPDSPGVLTPYPTFASLVSSRAPCSTRSSPPWYRPTSKRLPPACASQTVRRPRMTTVALPAGWFPLPMMLPLLVSRPPSSMLSEAPEPPMPKSSCPVPVFHSASCPLIVTSPDAPDEACPTVPPLLFTLPPFRTQRPAARDAHVYRGRSRIPFGIFPADRYRTRCAGRAASDCPQIAHHLAAVLMISVPDPP